MCILIPFHPAGLLQNCRCASCSPSPIPAIHHPDSSVFPLHSLPHMPISYHLPLIRMVPVINFLIPWTDFGIPWFVPAFDLPSWATWSSSCCVRFHSNWTWYWCLCCDMNEWACPCLGRGCKVSLKMSVIENSHYLHLYYCWRH